MNFAILCPVDMRSINEIIEDGRKREIWRTVSSEEEKGRWLNSVSCWLDLIFCVLLHFVKVYLLLDKDRKRDGDV